MSRFDLNLLGALYALLTEQNVTRAAEMMNVTQPTMSGMLQRLRFQFDDPLLVRNGRGMVLTQFAVSLVEPVREAIKGVGSLVRAEVAFDPATSTRTITLVASSYSAAILIPRVIARMVRLAPGMRLRVQALSDSVEKMMVGDVDLCITTEERGVSSGIDDETKLQEEQLFSDELVCVVSRTHPLRDGADRDAYFRFPHVGVDAPGVSSTILAAHRARVPDYKPAYAVADFSLVPYTVASTDAIGIVPERVARIAAQTFALRSFAPPLNLPTTVETLRWCTRHQEEPALVWFRSVIAEEARACMDIGGQSLWRLSGVDFREAGHGVHVSPLTASS